MSNGTGGECDLACQTKIILNGRNIAGVAESNQEALVAFFAGGGKIKNGHKIIALLNKIEDDVVEAQKLIAESCEYTGPTGKMLKKE